MSFNQSKIAALCGVGLLAAALLIWYELRSPVPKIDRTPIIGIDRGIGEILAEETLKAIGGQGHIVMVSDFDHDQPRGRVDERWDTFRQEMKKHSAVIFDGAEVVEHDPNEDQVMGCPSQAFLGILARHPDADAIIFFVDLPEWLRVSSAVPAQPKFKLLAVHSAGVPTRGHYGGYLTQGLLAALIGGTRQPTAVTPQTKSPREWFVTQKRVYRTGDIDALSESAGAEAISQ